MIFLSCSAFKQHPHSCLIFVFVKEQLTLLHVYYILNIFIILTLFFLLKIYIYLSVIQNLSHENQKTCTTLFILHLFNIFFLNWDENMQVPFIWVFHIIFVCLLKMKCYLWKITCSFKTESIKKTLNSF